MTPSEQGAQWRPIDADAKLQPIFLARKQFSRVIVYVCWWDGDDEFPWAFMEEDGLINGLANDEERILGWQPITLPEPPAPATGPDARDGEG